MDRPTHYLDRVEFTPGEGWRRECEEFALLGSCEHALKAATWERS
ncbi:MAG: hypothetical protein ACRETX_00630 [Steroidobacteraceae bacterium]